MALKQKTVGAGGKVNVFAGGKYKIKGGIFQNRFRRAFRFHFKMNINIRITFRKVPDKSLQTRGTGNFRGAGNADAAFVRKVAGSCQMNGSIAFVKK